MLLWVLHIFSSSSSVMKRCLRDAVVGHQTVLHLQPRTCVVCPSPRPTVVLTPSPPPPLDCLPGDNSTPPHPTLLDWLSSRLMSFSCPLMRKTLQLLTSFLPTSRGSFTRVRPLLSPTAFSEPEVRDECQLRTSAAIHLARRCYLVYQWSC